MVTIELSNLGWENVSIVRIPHPRTNCPALFLVDGREQQNESDKQGHFLFEVLNFEQPCRSYFVDDAVVSDGNLRMVTPIDPLFIVLPIMSQHTQARTLSDHIYESVPSDVSEILCKKILSTQLEQIAFKKVAGDITAYAYSEESSLGWLEKKVRKTVRFLTEKGITRMESSISSNFSTSAVKKDEQEYLRYACDIVGDYLPINMKKKLLDKLGLPPETDRKRKTANSVGGDGTQDSNIKKKQKVDGEEGEGIVTPLEDYSSPTSNAAAAANAVKGAKAKLVKAAQGSHSLFKFFSPKQ